MRRQLASLRVGVIFVVVVGSLATGRTAIAGEPVGPAGWTPVIQATDAPNYVGITGSPVFDDATGQLMLAEGTDTWTWDGARWAHRPDAAGPHVADPVSAYDPSTKQVVMVGGPVTTSPVTALPPGTQTWTWNGNVWAQQHPATSPAMAPACAAFDDATGQLLMFGGLFPQSPATWRWTGSNWVRLSPAASPPNGQCSMAYDPGLNTMVLATVGATFGGPRGTVQLWTWDGTNWHQLPSTVLPGDAGTPSIVYDPDAGDMVVLVDASGIDMGVNGRIWGGAEEETWAWNGTSWSMLYATTPANRIPFDLVIAYDKSTHQLVRWYENAALGAARGGSSVSPARIAGQDRLATAVAASVSAFPVSQAASAVVLARSDQFADALAGGPLAAANHGPLLLTSPTTLDTATATEISRVLKPGGTVFLVGGIAALGPSIASAIATLGYAPVRVSGADRFGTALAIAAKLGNPSTVFEANGAGFADALSAVPAAIVKHGAILLTGSSTLTPATAAYVRAHPGLHYAVGGPAASADPSAIALVGADRYATSTAVALAIFPDATGISVASGEGFPDALAAGPIVGEAGDPLLLVAPTDPLPEPTSAYLSTRGSAVSTAQVFGGTAAVSDIVMSQVAGALHGS
ncbi:MAG TPA: cell wall-binding repeat-containing protein [Acidothermaceae bacterium]